MKFMNLDKWLYQNPRDKADDGLNNGGGGGSDNKSEKQEGDEKITITQSQLTQLLSELLKGQNKDKDSDPESLSERRKREHEQEESQKKRDLLNQQFALRNLQFDTFISENEKILPQSMKTIRSDVEKSVKDKTDLSQTVPLMWGTAAKEFFGDPKNLQFLTKTDQEWVSQNVIGVRYEQDIDGVEAAKYMERAIEAAKRKADDSARRNGGQSGAQFDDYPNIKKYLDNFFAPMTNRYKVGAN
ncbi:TPA: hypothetical protein ACMD15_003400 [Vibrio cholerae]